MITSCNTFATFEILCSVLPINEVLYSFILSYERFGGLTFCLSVFEFFQNVVWVFELHSNIKLCLATDVTDSYCSFSLYTVCHRT
jgi:hypothetical protein